MLVNRKCSEEFAIERSVRQGCPLSFLLYVLALEPQLRRLRDEKANPALCGVPFAGRVKAKVSAYADDITVFVSHRLDILAVKVVERYEEVEDAKINFEKSEGLRLGAWRGGIPLPGPLPLDWQTRLHPRHVVQARPPTGEKLIGGTG